MYRTSYLSSAYCWPRPPIPVGSVRHKSSASAETSPCGAEPFWWLCPSPSKVSHLRSACPGLDLLHHRLHPSHLPHRQNLQHRSDRLRQDSSYPHLLFWAYWLSVTKFHLISYDHTIAESLSLRLQLAFSPQRALYPHNPRSITPSPHCLKSAFAVCFPLRASIWNASCTLLLRFGPFPPPNWSCLQSLDDVVVWISSSICRICPPSVARGSFLSTDHCIFC